MDTDIWMELDGIQTELAGGIGLIAVIADGLSAFSQDCTLSGEGRERYMNALYGTFDTLRGANGRLREQLNRAKEHGV